MTTRYSLPEHLAPEDHDRAAAARAVAALVLVGGVFTLAGFVGATVWPEAEATLAAAAHDAPVAESLPGA